MEDRVLKETLNDHALRELAVAALQKNAALPRESLETLSPDTVRRMLNEQEARRLELEIQNKELLRAQLEVDGWRSSYFDLFDLAPVGYVTVSESGLILQANRAAATLLGVRQVDLIRKPFPRFMHHDDADNYYLLSKQVLETNGSKACEVRMVKSDGTSFWVHLAATGAPNEDGLPRLRVALSDISALKQAEQALRESEERHRRLVQSAVEGIWTIDAASRTDYVNPKMAEMMGYSAEEMLGRPLDDFMDDEGRAMLVDLLNRRKGGVSEQFEFKYVRKNGTKLWAFVSTNPLFDLNSKYVGAQALLTDISAHREAEAALRASEDRYRRIVQTAEEGIWTIDSESRTDYVNPKMAQMLGYHVEEMIGRPLEDFMDEEGRAISANNVKRRQQGIAEQHEFKFLRKNGSELWSFLSTNPIFNASGAYVGALAMVTDITERRHASQLLAWEKEALEMVGSAASLYGLLGQLMLGLEKQLQGAVCSVLLLDASGKCVRHGAAPSLPETYNDLIDGLMIGPAVGSCGTAAYTGRQVIVSDISNDPLWSDYRELALAHNLHACWSTPICSVEGKVLGTFAIYYRTPRHPVQTELDLIARAVHITRIAIERSYVEEALRGSEKKFRTLFENAGDALLLVRGDKFIDCNTRTLEMFGCTTHDQIVGHPPYDFSPPLQPNGRESYEFAIEKINAAYAGQTQYFEWTHSKINGTLFLAEVRLDVVYLGEEVLLQASVRDITELRQHQIQREQFERNMQEAQKLESLGVLAGGIAHDFNNILAAILGNAELLRLDLMSTSYMKLERLEEIRKAGSRARDLVQQILSFSRRQPTELKLMAVEQVVAGSLRLLRAGLPARLKLAFKCEADMPLVRADATQMEQVVINLVTNAMQAIQDGPGQIDIHLDTVLFDSALLQSHPVLARFDKASSNRIVRLTVIDNGPGIEANTIKRVFEPFFTTKPVGEGTGLGLSVVHGIVQGHHGAIEVESHLGRGSTFTVFLPIAPEQDGTIVVNPNPVPSAASTDKGADSHILFLDDDESVTRMVKQLLQLSGYRVDAYTDQRQALEAISADPAHFDVVVTDYNMPGMQGLDVAREIRAIRADLPVAVTSGYIDEELRLGAAAAGVQELIPKPFAMRDFFAVVERLARNGKEKTGDESPSR